MVTSSSSPEVSSALGVAPMPPMMPRRAYMTPSGNPAMTSCTTTGNPLLTSSRLLSAADRPFTGTWGGRQARLARGAAAGAGYLSDGDGTRTLGHCSGYVSEGNQYPSSRPATCNTGATIHHHQQQQHYLDNVDDDDDR